MQHHTETLIIGGGVIGCAIAYYLRKQGMAVTLLEQGEIGGQASSAAAGLLAPLGPLPGPGPFADLLLAGFALFPSLVPELEEASGLRLGYDQAGALRLVHNPRRVANLRKRMQAWQPLGLAMHWLTGEEARQLEPLLSPSVCAAIYVPQEAQIKSPQVVRAFALAANNLGAHLHSHTPVSELLHQKARVTGVVTTTGETVYCERLVLATGAWSARYSACFDVALPVSPLKGQLLALRQPAPPLRHIIFGDSLYLAPRDDSIIVGATREEAGFDTSVTDEGFSWLRDTASRLVPSLEQCHSVASWAGLRPKTPDSRPILGPLPGWENVILATGHNSVGIILSAITGQAIADLLATGQCSPLIHPFSVARFQSPS
ncbi:MAG: glycine oxidase ThiO [Ktedonobacteraceae bacterium]|nr:glycine oxidase ThiO [Ktedonobacteraceae bacterium]